MSLVFWLIFSTINFLASVQPRILYENMDAILNGKARAYIIKATSTNIFSLDNANSSGNISGLRPINNELCDYWKSDSRKSGSFLEINFGSKH